MPCNKTDKLTIALYYCQHSRKPDSSFDKTKGWNAEVRFLVEETDLSLFHRVQTGSESTQDLIHWVTVSYLWEEVGGWCVNLTFHLHAVSRSRMMKLYLQPHTPSCGWNLTFISSVLCLKATKEIKK
jgi:hypothetical protein